MRRVARRDTSRLGTILFVCGLILVGGAGVMFFWPEDRPEPSQAAVADGPLGFDASDDDRDTDDDSTDDETTAGGDMPAWGGLSGGFDGPVTGLERRRTITLRITTDVWVRWAYQWRDGEPSAVRQTTSGDQVTRTFRTALPAALIAVQPGPEGGAVTCSVIIDGQTVTSTTVTEPWDIAYCKA